MTRTCSTCGTVLGRMNRSGLCKPCVARRNASDPALRDRMQSGLRAKMQDPEYRAIHVARCIRNGREMSDEARARRRELGRQRADTLRAANAALTPEIRADNGRKRTETVLAWCPPEWRAKYKDLTRRGRRAAEAKQIVLGLIAGRPQPLPYAQQRAKLAWCPPERLDEYRKLQKAFGAAESRRIIEDSMSSFDRQLARVRMSARVVAKVVTRPVDPTHSLIGCATGML